MPIEFFSTPKEAWWAHASSFLFVKTIPTKVLLASKVPLQEFFFQKKTLIFSLLFFFFFFLLPPLTLFLKPISFFLSVLPQVVVVWL
jgi:hypothetical protein